MLLHLDCMQRNERSRRTFVACFFTSCTTLSGIIRKGSVFMSTPKRLLHCSTSVRVRRVSRGVFFYLCYVFFRHVFLQPELTLNYIWNKQKRQHVWYVWYVYTSIYALYVHIICQVWHICTTINIYMTAALLHVAGTQVEIQYTAVRVNVPGTYIYIISYILRNNKQPQQ